MLDIYCDQVRTHGSDHVGTRIPVFGGYASSGWDYGSYFAAGPFGFNSTGMVDSKLPSFGAYIVITTGLN